VQIPINIPLQLCLYSVQALRIALYKCKTYLLTCLRYSASNSDVSLKYGLEAAKVIENGTIRKLGYGFLLTVYSNDGRIVSEIKRFFGRKSRFFHTPCTPCHISGLKP